MKLDFINQSVCRILPPYLQPEPICFATRPPRRDQFLRGNCPGQRANQGVSTGISPLRDKLIKIGAKVVSHGRYVIFQMAEVAVSRQMFEDILILIARLRAPPALT
jgi:hypothetical protein